MILKKKLKKNTCITKVSKKIVKAPNKWIRNPKLLINTLLTVLYPPFLIKPTGILNVTSEKTLSSFK